MSVSNSTPTSPTLDTLPAPARHVELKLSPEFKGRISTRLDPRLTLVRTVPLRKRYRVAAVVPCHGRQRDLELLLRDLSRLDAAGIDLWITVVDNASPVPLSTITIPPGLEVEIVRREENTGGAGGFNAAMSHVLRGEGISARRDAPDFVWLLDSDARVSKRCLRELLRGILSRDDLAAVGSALVDPVTRQMFEVGGTLRGLGAYFGPTAKGDVDRRFLVESHYLAACSTLVRRTAIEATGLFPDIFIHGDDVEWFLQMTRKTGLKVAGAPRSVAYHPVWTRKFQTWFRYYATRNVYAPIDVCGFGPFTRFYHAAMDSCRAAAQAMMGLPELAELHLQGLADAAAGRTVGFGPRGGLGPILAATKTTPYSDLSATVRRLLGEHEDAHAGRRAALYFHPFIRLRSIDFPGLGEQIELLGLPPVTPADRDAWNTRSLQAHRFLDAGRALCRFLLGTPHAVAIVPTGWPTGWFRAPTLIQVTSDGFLVRRVRRPAVVRQALSCLWRGGCSAVRLALRRRQINPLPPAPTRPALRLTQG